MLTFEVCAIAALAVSVTALAIMVMVLSKQVRSLRDSLRSLRIECSSTKQLATDAARDAAKCKGQTVALSQAVTDIIKEGGDRRYMRAS